MPRNTGVDEWVQCELCGKWRKRKVMSPYRPAKFCRSCAAIDSHDRRNTEREVFHMEHPDAET